MEAIGEVGPNPDDIDFVTLSMTEICYYFWTTFNSSTPAKLHKHNIGNHCPKETIVYGKVQT